MDARDGTEKPRKLTSKSAYLALLMALPVFVLSCIIGKWETGIGAWICAALVLLIVRQRWDLRRRVWFWIVIAAAFLLQVPLVLWIPWGNRGLTGISLLPLGLLDYGLVYGCLRLIEMATVGKHEESKQS